MVKSGSGPARRRKRRRQAVQQAMATAQVPANPSAVCDPNLGKPRSRRRPASGVPKKLLALLPQLIIASINVNSLTPETEWAITSILEGQKYDVSAIPFFHYICYIPLLSGALFERDSRSPRVPYHP